MAIITCDINSCSICFGYLYNWYAVDDSRKLISNDQWTIPTTTQWGTLYSYHSVGIGMKTDKLSYWNTDDGTNEQGFDGRGHGWRRSTGTFEDLLSSGAFHTSVSSRKSMTDAMSSFNTFSEFDETGMAVRLVKDATGLADGITTTYIGNDGKVYNAIVIDELYWTQNLEETKFRNGDLITYVSDDTAWSNLVTEGVCVYDNNVSYACKAPVITVI